MSAFNGLEHANQSRDTARTCSFLLFILFGVLGCARDPAGDGARIDHPSPPVENGITADEDAQIPPGPPGTVRVSRGAGGVHRIAWRGTRDDTILGYEVHKRCSTQDWETIAFVKLAIDDERNRGEYSFDDASGVGCEYTISAVGQNGKPGPKSTEIQ